jgi:hypothetical protein
MKSFVDANKNQLTLLNKPIIKNINTVSSNGGIYYLFNTILTDISGTTY